MIRDIKASGSQYSYRPNISQYSRKNQHSNKHLSTSSNGRKYSNYFSNQIQQQSNTESCQRCREQHKYKCPAAGVICRKCGRKSHYAKLCGSNICIRDVEADSAESSDADSLFLGLITQSPPHKSLPPSPSSTSPPLSTSQSWNITVEIKNKQVNCLLDTGAQANVISYTKFKQLQLSAEHISPSKTRLLTFTKAQLPILGECKIECVYKNRIYLHS